MWDKDSDTVWRWGGRFLFIFVTALDTTSSLKLHLILSSRMNASTRKTWRAIWTFLAHEYPAFAAYARERAEQARSAGSMLAEGHVDQ
jgi:predicted transcriptional regulator